MEYKLEPSEGEIRQILELTTEKLIAFLDNVANPVVYDVDKARQDAIHQSEPMPEEARSLEVLLNDLFENKIPYALPATSPGFMAYIPGGGLFHSALADLIAKITNRYIGVDFAAPYLSQLEADVLKWFCEMVGYPATAGGVLTSGGSIANLTAVICARTVLLGDDFTKATVYASSYAHHSNWKALRAAGISSKQLRNIPVDGEFRMDMKQLEKSIKTDIEQGYVPLMVIASAGSTNTGTIDQLEDIARLCKQYGCWYHIDAAYGGFFTMTESGKQLLSGIELADSITLDPHKGLFLPYGTGAILVKDRENLKKTFQHEADYLPDNQSGLDVWDFSDMSLEMTRPFRGLGIWLPFKLFGAGVFRQTLDEKLQLASYFHEKLSQNSQWKIVAAPELSLTVFRYQDDALGTEQLNRINQEIIEYVNQKCRVNLSGTTVGDYFVIRSCILSFRTHQEHIDWLLEDLEEASRVVTNSIGCIRTND